MPSFPVDLSDNTLLQTGAFVNNEFYTPKGASFEVIGKYYLIYKFKLFY